MTHLPVSFGNDGCDFSKLTGWNNSHSYQTIWDDPLLAVCQFRLYISLPPSTQYESGCAWSILYPQMDSPLMCSQETEMIYWLKKKKE